MNALLKNTIIFSLLFVNVAMADEPILPKLTLTPGMVDPDATNEKLCISGYTGTVRNVSEATKKKVFREYNISPKEDKFEVDHLISLEIGGSNDIRNLWPQSYDTTPWNAHVKDKLENKLHKMICDGIITKEDAQKQISTDWIKTYCSIYDDKKEDCDNYLKTK